MKKWTALFLVFLMLIPSVASASGLAGLKGASAPSLPDPEAVLSAKGSLLQADYQFSEDFLCDAYLYAYAGKDVLRYLAAAQQAGFETSAETVDGQAGHVIALGELKALLVPEFEGGLLLLGEKGMAFDGAKEQTASEKPAPTAAPQAEAEKDEYVTMTHNGRTCECTSPLYSNGREPLHNAYNIWLTPHGSKITSINFTIPQYAKSGDSFVVWKDQAITGLEFYVAEDNSFGQYYVSDMGSFHSQGFAASTDYYVLKVDSLELKGGVTVIEGTIRARFLYDTISFEIDFKVKVP